MYLIHLKYFIRTSINVPGSVVIPTVEGTRPLLVEIQALVSSSTYMQPRRTADGIDIKRIQLLLAVLEKRNGIIFSNWMFTQKLQEELR